MQTCFDFGDAPASAAASGGCPWLSLYDAAVEARRDGAITKELLISTLGARFRLARERAVYVGEHFAIRFCFSSVRGFSNCVLSLSAVQRYDDNPLVVCLLSPEGVEMFLANSTFIARAGHSSHRLSMECVRGTILGSDILREVSGVPNRPEHFARLLELHAETEWEDNLSRIVVATNGITSVSRIYAPTLEQKRHLLDAPHRSHAAEACGAMAHVENALIARLAGNRDGVLRLARCANGCLRGNSIEQLLTGAPNGHRLADCSFDIDGGMRLLVDVKTKLFDRSSNPKLYNVDKMLRGLSDGRSVMAFFLIGIDVEAGVVRGRLIDALDYSVMVATRIQFHWAGRSSRGVTQYAGAMDELFAPAFTRCIRPGDGERFVSWLMGSGPDGEPEGSSFDASGQVGFQFETLSA